MYLVFFIEVPDFRLVKNSEFASLLKIIDLERWDKGVKRKRIMSLGWLR